MIAAALLSGGVLAGALAALALRSREAPARLVLAASIAISTSYFMWNTHTQETSHARFVLAGLVATVAIAATLVTRGQLVAILGVLVAAELGALAAADPWTLAAAWGVSTLACTHLVFWHGGLRRRWAAGMLLVSGLAGVLLVGLAFDWMRSHVGGPVPAGGALTGLATHARRFGWRDGQEIFIALALAAVATRLPIFPLHGWSAALHAEAPTPVVMVASASFAANAFVLLVETAVLDAPAALRTLAPALVAVGTLQVAWAALLAIAQRDAFRLNAHLSLALAGTLLASLGTLAPQGADAALAAIAAHTLLVPLAVLVTGTLHARLGHRYLPGWGGLRHASAPLAFAGALAWFGVAGVPGGGALLAWVLAIASLAANHPVAAAIVALAWTALLSAAFAAFRRTFLGPPTESVAWDHPAGERAALVALGLATVALGLGGPALVGFMRDDLWTRLQVVVDTLPWR